MKKTLCYIAACLLLFVLVSQVLPGEERVLHRNKRPKIIDLKPNDVTTVMGYRAEFQGSLRHAPMPEPRFYKEAVVYGFDDTRDELIWTVRAPEAAGYQISLLYTGADRILEDCQVELSSGGTVAKMKPLVHTWEGKPFFIRAHFERAVLLRKGKNEISLRLSKISPDSAEALAQDNRESETQNNRLLKTNSFGVWSLELAPSGVREKTRLEARKLRSDRSWMVAGKYGLFVTWSPLCYGFRDDRKRQEWHEDATNMFDVEAFADAVEETGAAWVLFTTTHGSVHWPGPSKTIDRILRGRTTERDLIGELAGALHDRGIRLTLYYHFGAHANEDAEWANAVGAYDETPERFVENVESLLRETSLRYGEKVQGFGYFDDCGMITYQYDPSWERWARAIKAGNRNGLVGFSPSWGPSVSPYNELEITDGGTQLRLPSPPEVFGPDSQHGDVLPHRWFAIDAWCNRKPYNGTFAHAPGPRHAREEYVRYFQEMAAAGVPLTVNMAITADVTRDHPFFNPACMNIMRAVRKAVRGK